MNGMRIFFSSLAGGGEGSFFFPSVWKSAWFFFHGCVGVCSIVEGWWIFSRDLWDLEINFLYNSVKIYFQFK